MREPDPVALHVHAAPTGRPRGRGRRAPPPGRFRRGPCRSSPSPWRTGPNSWRSSASASRPVRSIRSATWVAWSGRFSTIRRAPPACTTITLRLWASTSCSSRAMRERSLTIARRSSSSRACSASSAFSASSRASSVWLRIARPASQGAMPKMAIGKNQSLGSKISTTVPSESDHQREPAQRQAALQMGARGVRRGGHHRDRHEDVGRGGEDRGGERHADAAARPPGRAAGPCARAATAPSP